MSQSPQPLPNRAFTDEEKAQFEACFERLRGREDVDASILPYPGLVESTLFYLWQQATREAKQ